MGEAEVLDVNYCITIEDDFGFAIKDFVKPTPEGRQFINGNSHYLQVTFKLILFAEAITLRRLNQRRLPQQLKPTQRKRDLFKLSLEHG